MQMLVLVGGVVLVVGLVTAMAVSLWGMWVIRPDESGLVVKRFGPPLASGRIIAVNGEAGWQARMLPPGWHYGYWRGRYSIVRVPVVVVAPGEIALVVASDGAAIPPERVLARQVECDNFQD